MMMEASLEGTKAERVNFIGRVQEQRQFLVALQGLLAHHHHWFELARKYGADFDPGQGPGDDSYACIFLLHGIGGIGKSWLARRCLTLAEEMPNDPSILALYDDVSLGSPVLRPDHLLDRLHDQLAQAGYEAQLAAYRRAKADTPGIVDLVIRYQFENREQWDKLLQMATDLLARGEPEAGYLSFAETSLAYTHASGAEAVGQDATTLAKAYDLLLERMQAEDKLTPEAVALFRNPPAAQAAQLVAGLNQIASKRPLVIGLDNLEIVVPLEPFIRDCLVLSTNQSPIIWLLSGRYSLADERMVEVDGERRTHKGYRDLLGENPPVVWDMSIFGDADLREYLEAEAERRRISLVVEDDLIEAVKATSSGVPLVVEMVADALFTMDREEFLREFALDDKSLLPDDRLEQITARFLRYCLTREDDLERVQAMALLRNDADEPALAAVWGLLSYQARQVRDMLYDLRTRYAFVLPEGLHDAVYEFVRRQLRTTWQYSDVRERLSRRAITHYRARWEELDAQFDDPTLRIRNPHWQRATRDLVNALLWSAPDEAVLFLLPRFVEGLGFDRAFSNGLLTQAEEFLVDSVSTFSRAYANLLHRMRVGLQDIDWVFDEPGEAIEAMLETLLQAPGLAPLHLSILHLWRGNRLVESGEYEEGLTAYMEADQHRPADAVGLGQQLSKALYELSSRFLWPVSASETVPSEPGLQAARRAVELDAENGAAWFNMGVALDYLGQEEEAISAYEEAIELEPRPNYYTNLGDVYNTLGRDDEAIAAYEQAVELDPTYPWSYHSLGLINAEHGDYESALDLYQQAIERHQNDKDRAVSWDSFGDAHFALEDYEEAISAYRWAGVLNPRYAPPWYSLGNIYSTLERDQEAIDAYRRAIDLDPTYAWSYHNLGLVYARQDDSRAAIAHFQQAIERHETGQEKAVSWNSLGDAYGSVDQYQAAVAAYRQAIELDPQQASPWNSLGDIYHISGQTEAAVTAYQRAIELEPDYASPWNSLGDIFRLLQRYDEAIKAYQRVIALEPDYAWPYHNLGLIYREQGQYKKALTFSQQAIERHEDDEGEAISWNNLGDIQVALKNREDAMKAYRQAIILAPDYAWPYHNLGLVYEAQGDYEPAVGLYQQAIERHRQDEDRAVSWRSLADVYRQLARHREAIQAYRKVVGLDPEDAGPWNSLGDVYLAMTNYDEASQAYRQAIQLDPDYAWPYHSLGLISARSGKYESALTLYRQAIERHEDDRARAVSWNKLGDAYVALPADPEEAIRAYQQAIQLDPDYAWPYHSLGLIYEQRGEYESALKFYRQAIKRYPREQDKDRAVSWNGLGNVYQAVDRLEEAREAYSQASEFDPTYALPWRSLGDICRTLEQYDEAIESYRQAIELDPTDARVYHNLGLVYEQQREYESAVTNYQQAIERYPQGQQQDKSICWNHLGNVYRVLEQDEQAINAYRQAIDLNAGYVDPWKSLGDIYITQQRRNAAIEAYRQAIKLDPTDAIPWNNLGDIYHFLKRYQQATEAYQQAVKLDPAYAWPYHNLGVIDEKLGKHESALNFYQQAIRRYPQDRTEDRALSWNGLGNIYRALARDQQALKAYQQAVALDSSYAQPQHGLGILYAKLGQYESAVECYRQAIKLYPEGQDKDRAVSWNNLGDVYGVVGRWDETIAAYQQAIELDPEYDRPWYSLGNIFSTTNRFDAAIDAYERAIELDPSHAWPYNNLGLVYENLAEYELALEYYQQAIERHTDDRGRAISWNNLGDIHQLEQQYEPAMKAYRQAIEFNPQYARPWNSLGDIYRVQSRDQEVVEAYQQAIKVEPAYAWPYHNLGLVYKNRGAYMQAVTYYKQALERHQRDQDKSLSWNGLGNVYRALERYDQATEAYQKAIELNPDDAWPYHNLGFVYKNLEAYDQAITLYQQAVERFEEDEHKAVSWNNLGNIYSAQGRYEPAVKAYRRAVELNPAYALPWNSLGNTYSRLKRYEKAIDAYQQAIKRNPKYARAWNNLGDVYHDTGRLEETIEAYERAIELDPQYAWPYHNLGLVYEERGDFESAIAYYQQAIERHQDSQYKAVLWDNIGNIHRVMAEGDKAIEAYRRATGLNPKYAPPWYSLGNIYAALERDEDAIKAYRRVIELVPDDAWPYHNLGLIYEKIEDHEQAIAFYLLAIEHHRRDQDRAVSWDNLGNVYSDVGRMAEAIHAYKESIRLNPTYALPWNSLGDAYSMLDDSPRAIEAYQHAIALDPNYAWPYNNLGLVYERLGQYEQAIALYEQVIERHINDQDRAVSWNSLGDVYGVLHREAEAIAAYEQAIRLDPDYAWPYNSLGAIYERRGERDQAFALYQQATRRHRQRTLVS